MGLIIGTNLLLGSVSLFASSQNYPGGVAITRLSQLHNATGPFSPSPSSQSPNSLQNPSDPTPLSIHIDSHTAMTGASRFLHSFCSPPEWYLSLPPPSSPSSSRLYNKSETLSAPSGDFGSFNYLLTGHPRRHEDAFEIVEVVRGFKRFRVALGEVDWGGGVEGVSPLKVVKEESVWIMKKRERTP